MSNNDLVAAAFKEHSYTFVIVLIALTIVAFVFSMKKFGKDHYGKGVYVGLFFPPLIAFVWNGLFNFFYTEIGFTDAFFSGYYRAIPLVMAIVWIFAGSVIATFLQRTRLRLIDPIQKERKVKNGGDLGQALSNTENHLNGILLAYTMPKVSGDDWNFKRKAFRVPPSERVLCAGMPGSGKTTFLIAQIIEWLKTGHSMIATDIKPEIWARLHENGLFERFGYKVYVFNPTSKISHKFNPFGEYNGVSELKEMLYTIIPHHKGDNAVFSDNARRILQAVMMHLGDNASIPAARRFINKAGSVGQLITYLENSDNESVQDIAAEVRTTASNERLMSSIMTTLTKAFEFCDDEVIRDNISGSDFKLSEVLLQYKTAVFFQFEQHTRNTTASLFGATIFKALKTLQSNQQKRLENNGLHFLILLDEIINSAPIPDFIEILNTLRSCNAPTWLYMQGLEKLRDLYGDNAVPQFLGACTMHIAFRIGDSVTATKMSDAIGKTNTLYLSQSSGATQNADSYFGNQSTNDSTGRSFRLENVIEPSEIMGLPDHSALVYFRGKAGILEMPIYFKDFPIKPKTSLERPETL